MEANEVNDATVYLQLVQSIILGQEMPFLFLKIGPILTNYKLKFVTMTNVLGLILCLNYPATTKGEVICEWIRMVNSGGEKEIDLDEFVLLNRNNDLPQDDDCLIQTAIDMVNKVASEAATYGFEIPKILRNQDEKREDDINDQGNEFVNDITPTQNGLDIMVKFVMAKTLHWSKFTNDISCLYPLFELVEGSKYFDNWYNGIISPFTYYSRVLDDVNLQFYLNSPEFSDQFNILIEPLLKHHSLSINDWMKNVILPLIKYHDYNIDPLLAWLFCPQIGKPSQKYELWFQVIESFVDSIDFQFDNYQEIIKCYLASVYYYSKDETNGRISSMEITKIYDTIHSTLNLLKLGNPTKIDIPLEANNTYLSFEEFITDSSNPLAPFFEPTTESLATLKEIIVTCQKLFASNKLTIHQYLILKSSDSIVAKEKEISKCCANLTKSNWSQWLNSIKEITKNFVNNDEKSRINALIIERFLFANLFEVVDNFLKTNEFDIDVETYYQLIMSKFWDSFNSSTSMNDKIGHLKDATECLQLFDGVNLLQSQREEVVKIKHLLKGIHNMKNYRIQFEKSGQLTPYQLINEFKYNPLELTTVILEQNTKSYLSFDKLYKILNDISIFFGIKDNMFNKLKTACIESSLIDGNFSFAYKQTMELLDHYNSIDLNDNWLTFYQVGKYINPNWFDGESQEKLDVLQRQSEILAKTLLIMNSTNENSQTVLRQWTVINSQINEFYSNEELSKIKDVTFKNMPHKHHTDIKEIGDLAKNYIHDVTATGTHASGKISNLLVSGLGWAIGANK